MCFDRVLLLCLVRRASILTRGGPSARGKVKTVADSCRIRARAQRGISQDAFDQALRWLHHCYGPRGRAVASRNHHVATTFDLRRETDLFNEKVEEDVYRVKPANKTRMMHQHASFFLGSFILCCGLRVCVYFNSRPPLPKSFLLSSLLLSLARSPIIVYYACI